MKILKIILAIIGILAILLGIVWILQGINVLPGSFMTGHKEWAYRGAALAVVGVALFWFSRRK